MCAIKLLDHKKIANQANHQCIKLHIIIAKTIVICSHIVKYTKPNITNYHKPEMAIQI